MKQKSINISLNFCLSAIAESTKNSESNCVIFYTNTGDPRNIETARIKSAVTKHQIIIVIVFGN